MKGKPKDGYHPHSSNKHYKQKLVQVLLGSGSDGELVFVSKDKPMLLPYSELLVPQSWNTPNGIFQTKHKARMELDFFDYSDSKKGTVQNPMWSSMRRIVRRSMTSFLVLKP
jgi:hypothetical protein